jgi:hypothetical protein
LAKFRRPAGNSHALSGLEQVGRHTEPRKGSGPAKRLDPPKLLLAALIGDFYHEGSMRIEPHDLGQLALDFLHFIGKLGARVMGGRRSRQAKKQASQCKHLHVSSSRGQKA